jgi:hypothetical protein
MADEVLRGIAGSDFADVLFRAAAFARVGRDRSRGAERLDRGGGTANAGDGRAARGGGSRRTSPPAGVTL